jgi:hypothetical protein
MNNYLTDFHIIRAIQKNKYIAYPIVNDSSMAYITLYIPLIQVLSNAP